MGTVKLLWFFLWRMTLLGLALGAALGAIYGAAILVIGSLVEEFSSDLPGEVPVHPVAFALGLVALAAFGGAGGTFIGAPVGLFLGALDGLVLAVLTLGAYRHAPLQRARLYREAAGVACAAVALLAFAADWWLHGFPDADAFVFWRLPPFFEEASGRTDRLGLETALPTLVAVLAMWWAGRKVAARYARRTRSAPERTS